MGDTLLSEVCFTISLYNFSNPKFHLDWARCSEGRCRVSLVFFKNIQIFSFDSLPVNFPGAGWLKTFISTNRKGSGGKSCCTGAGNCVVAGAVEGIEEQGRSCAETGKSYGQWGNDVQGGVWRDLADGYGSVGLCIKVLMCSWWSSNVQVEWCAVQSGRVGGAAVFRLNDVQCRGWTGSVVE